MPPISLIVIWVSIMVILLTLLGFTAYKASRLKGKPLPPIRKPLFDHDIAVRASKSLSELISFETVSDNAREWGEWVRLREYLKTRYPLFHETLSREVIGHSLLFTWPAFAATAGSAASASGKSNKKITVDNDINTSGSDSDSAGEKENLPLLFCAHLDVTPPGSEFSVPPFSGLVKDGYVWGRGALDCKNVLCCLMEAVESLLAEGFSPGRDIYFAFGHDEEIGGNDGAGAISKLFMQRGLRFSMTLDEGGALTRGIIPAGRPVAEVCVAEKGMVNLKLSAKGAGGHASVPPKSTALGRLGEALARLEFRGRKSILSPVIKNELMLLAPYAPSKIRFKLANLWLFKRSILKNLSREPKGYALLHTTAAPTMARCGLSHNVLPETAEAVVNARLLHGDDEARLLSYLRDLTADLGIEIEVIRPGKPSRISPHDGEYFDAIAKSTEEVFGPVPVVPGLFPGMTDSRYYDDFSDCVYRFMPFILTPDELRRIHGPDERVLSDALGAGAAFYKSLIKRLSGGGGESNAPAEKRGKNFSERRAGKAKKPVPTGNDTKKTTGEQPERIKKKRKK